MKRIGDKAFSHCERLEMIKIPASVEELTGFTLCKSLSVVQFDEESCLRSIMDFAFSGCKQLTEIEIPSTVEVLDKRCFACMDNNEHAEMLLSRVMFAPGSDLKRIGIEAFDGCRMLDLDRNSS